MAIRRRITAFRNSMAGTNLSVFSLWSLFGLSESERPKRAEEHQERNGEKQPSPWYSQKWLSKFQ